MLSKKALFSLVPLFLIILLAFILRFWMLGQVPISMTDDEIREVYASYSLAHTGRDVLGNFLPLVFKSDGFNTMGPVPVYLRAFFFLILPLNAFTARFPYALASFLSVVLIYLIGKKLFNNGIGLCAAFVASVSVWQLQMSRFAIETEIALFFYLLGVCIYLYSANKFRNILASMIILFLAFYTYVAFKVLFLPLMLALTWYKYKRLTKSSLALIIMTVILAFGTYGILNITQKAASYTGSNGAAFFFQDKAATDTYVELARRESREPTIIENTYYNKFTYWTRYFATNYLIAFSPQYLFLNQEASGIYSIWGRGEFYIFELPLALIGLLFLFTKKRKDLYFLLLLLLVSPLPSALGIGTPTWTSRSALMAFWLYIFVGAGIYCLFELYKKRLLKYIVIAVISLCYFYAVVGYVYQYYYSWSQSNAKYFSKSTQDLVFTINKYQTENKQIIVSGAIGNTFLHYAFYNKLNPKIVQQLIAQKPIIYQKVTFMEDCWVKSNDPYRKINNKIVYIVKASCQYKTKPSGRINAYAGSEVVWNIYKK